MQEAALDTLVDRLPAGDVDDGVLVVNPSLAARPIQVALDDEVLASTLTVPALSARVVARADLATDIPVVTT
ncbi:hypothetical protein J8J27_28705, partial [Mycobacterium tuberculosis]|nr:hypothetical protein [Mycobacterium tuberculosis]